MLRRRGRIEITQAHIIRSWTGSYSNVAVRPGISVLVAAEKTMRTFDFDRAIHDARAVYCFPISGISRWRAYHIFTFLYNMNSINSADLTFIFVE